MDPLGRLGSTVGKIGKAYREETEKVISDAREKYGFVISTVGENRIRRSTNLELFLFMYNPRESLIVRIIATLQLLENNLDFLETVEDEHVANAITYSNQMGTHWVQRLGSIARAEDEIREAGLTGNLQAQTVYETALAIAEIGVVDWMGIVKSIVDAAGHSKSDHIREAIVIGQMPIMPPTSATRAIEPPTKPVADKETISTGDDKPVA